jgi:hypothetical protein
VEILRAAKIIRFCLGRFSTNAPTQYPVVVRLPVAPIANQVGGQLQKLFEMRIQWPSLTVRDWQALEQAAAMLRAPARVEFVTEQGGKLVASGTVTTGLQGLPDTFSSAIGRGFRGLDKKTPIPMPAPVDELRALARRSQSECEAAWRARRQRGAQEMPRLTTLYVRLVGSNGGVPFDETYVRLLPWNFFHAPKVTMVEGHNVTVEEFERRWEAAEEDIQIHSHFETDIFDLADVIQKWARSPDGPFPLSGSSSGPMSPNVRTLMVARFLPAIDRIWYKQRPVVFEFRPVTRAEAYGQEAHYWRSISDHRRAELAEEIKARLEAEEANKRPPPLDSEKSN